VIGRSMRNINKASKNALRDFKISQEEANHNALVQAFHQIINGNPKVVKKGTRLSVTSVAKEASLSRGTVYLHKDILEKINNYKDNPRLSDYKRKKALEAKEAEKVEKSKLILTQLEVDKNKLAQENYRLTLELSGALDKISALSKEIINKKVVNIRGNNTI